MLTPVLRFAAITFLTVTTAVVSMSSAGRADELPAATRPAQWASPVDVAPGVPNLFRVDAGLYRAAQPSIEGFITLGSDLPLVRNDRPIHTVLSLRAMDDDRPMLSPHSRLQLEQINFFTWSAEDEDVVKFLRIVTTPAMQPVLVHCQHGADRTGTMIAIYRIVVQGWTKQQALDEMINGGYGFHPIWQNLVGYINRLDVAAIRAELAKAGPWQPTIPPLMLSLTAFHQGRAER